VTDADGRFAEFDAPVFTRDGRTFAFTAADATAMRVDLAAGETKSMDVVVGSRPAFVVTGRLTGIVPGGVVNDALVTVAEGDHTLPLIQAFTDFDGRFGIPALPAGHYVVSARRGVCAAAAGVDADGWPGRFQCDVIFEDAHRWSGTTTIDLDEQGRLAINGAAASEIHIEMAPQLEGPFDGLVRKPLVPHVTRRGTSTLDGIVSDTDHHPLAYTHVAIFSADLGGARATVTDDQGQFAFYDLPPVAVRLLAAPPGAPALEYGGAGPGTDGAFIAIPDRQQIHIVWMLPKA
jgi:hypothetical protein